jgi:hypothetical protein
MVPPLLLTAGAALLLLLSPTMAAADNNHRYCGSDTPLDTPYFAPFQQTAVEAVGCQEWPPSPPAAPSYVTHVIRLEDPPPEVSLHIAGKMHLASKVQHCGVQL